MNLLVMALMMIGMMVVMHGHGNHAAAHGDRPRVQADDTRPSPPGVNLGSQAMERDLPHAEVLESRAGTLPEAP